MIKKGETTVMRSIGVKICFLVMVTAIIVAAGILGSVLQGYSENMEKQIEQRILDTAQTYRNQIEAVMDTEETNSEFYKKQLEGVKLTGLDSSYLYLVNQEGIMLYHPTAEMIGEPVENSVVKQMLNDINAGKEVKDDVVSYEFKGNSRL